MAEDEANNHDHGMSELEQIKEIMEQLEQAAKAMEIIIPLLDAMPHKSMKLATASTVIHHVLESFDNPVSTLMHLFKAVAKRVIEDMGKDIAEQMKKKED